MKDYLFALTEYSENEGEYIFCEETSLDAAWECLLGNYGFRKEELRYVDEYEPWEAEILGYDTY